MIIIGERINGTGKRVQEAVVGRDADYFVEEAKRQTEAGAHYLDLNAGTTPERENDDLVWLVKTVEAAVETPVCLDSANVEALRAGLETATRPAMINSASAEEARLKPVLELAQSHDARVVCLTMDQSGLPKTAEQRVEIAKRIADAADGIGIPQDHLFMDPLARAVGVENEQGAAFLEGVAGIRGALPDVHITCGLSNISFQLPARRLLNRTFLAMAIAHGLDSAIVDPLDGGLMATIAAAAALLGEDEMCMDYIGAYRAGRLVD